MRLTDVAVRKTRRTGKMFDGGGLFLEILPSGAKSWRIKYRYGGKERRLTLGLYPGITLKDARARLAEARALLEKGVDPAGQKRAARAARALPPGLAPGSFQAVATDWLGQRARTISDGHVDTLRSRLRRDVFPVLGARPISEIGAAEVLAMLRGIEARGTLETARRAKQTVGQVFRYAVACGMARRDPTPDLKEAMMPHRVRHRAAVIEPTQVAELLRSFDGFSGTVVVSTALRVAPLVFVRPGELRRAEWAEVDLAAGLWIIPARRMKMDRPHLVPLSSQAVTLLRDLWPFTAESRYVFPSARTNTRPMSNVALLAALRRLGWDRSEMTVHGFRAIARTLLDEQLGWRPDIIEHQLAHQVRDPHGRAYNRTQFLPERRKMMQEWADYLDGLKGSKQWTR